MLDSDDMAVAHQINQNFPSTKAILISAYEERLYEEMATKEGALAFISCWIRTPQVEAVSYLMSNTFIFNMVPACKKSWGFSPI